MPDPVIPDDPNREPSLAELRAEWESEQPGDFVPATSGDLIPPEGLPPEETPPAAPPADPASVIPATPPPPAPDTAPAAPPPVAPAAAQAQPPAPPPPEAAPVPASAPAGEPPAALPPPPPAPVEPPAEGDGAPTNFSALLDEMMAGDLANIQVTDYRDPNARMSAAELAGEYRGMAELGLAQADALVRRRLEEALAPILERMKGLDPVLEQAREMDAARAEAAMLEAVRGLGGVEDPKAIADDPKFWSWIGEQAPGLKQLAQSNEPRDVHFLMKSYALSQGATPAQAHAAADQAASEAAAAHARENELHGGALRTTGQFPRAPGAAGEPTREELERAWREE